MHRYLQTTIMLDYSRIAHPGHNSKSDLLVKAVFQFHQTKGIPMGGKARPLIDIYISFLVGISISEQTCYKQRFQSTT